MISALITSSSFGSTYAGTCRRIVRDFTDLPGLRLTSAQARRLWQLEPFASDAILGALVDAEFLVCDSQGVFSLRGRIERAPAAEPAPFAASD